MTDGEIAVRIGKAALLEQTAEEATELAQACLKLARKMRGDNPTPATIEDLACDMHEEAADVITCMAVMREADMLDKEAIRKIAAEKIERWKRRIEAEGGAE